MTRRQRFIRKIIYGCLIGALLLPLSWLSQPATRKADDQMSEGGMLSQMRAEYGLGQANLGEIDPASQTIKLATLGLHSVAFNILWEKANYYKKTEDWSSLSATLEQMTKLEPNYVSVWIYQGWNLSYNISVEFDDYHDRYHWVIKGIDYLKEGTTYNKDEPLLVSEIGRGISQKIGRSDEHVQFRRLFREDDDFNAALPRSQRDNWLVGRDWFLRAEQMIERGISNKGRNPTLFHSQPVMCLVNYAESLEEEGTFGEVAKDAWRKASDAWKTFSNRDLATLYNNFIRIGEKETYDEEAKEARQELERIATPELIQKIKDEKYAALDEDEREAWEAPSTRRTKAQREMFEGIREKLEVGPLEIANRVTGPNHAEALKAAERQGHAEFMSQIIDTERGVLNYDYWMLRCQVEPEDDTLAARKLVYDGDRAVLQTHLKDAPDLYVEGLKKWRLVLDRHPAFLRDQNFVDELVESIDHYRQALSHASLDFPSPFILQDVLDSHSAFHASMVDKSAAANKADSGSPAAQKPQDAPPATEEKPADQQPADDGVAPELKDPMNPAP